ncbi:Ig-like domain-containing protein [Paenibacillus camerounensis]|uniref:Ig-like domain-containing protein n=1 Tax=Paenibacillus camerounensis TaxID=1243663 RepID=UPI0006948332|nr:Ig-like domain-containing protein [Paenibacillus camerounensis]
MAFQLRYNTTMNGAMTFTGNTLGLNKTTNQNNQGIVGSIGAFSTLNTALQAGNFPLGTTLNYTLNASSAVLNLPAGASVLYAELIWSASYNTGGNNLIGLIGSSVTFTTPAGVFSVAPDPATAVNTAPAAPDYVNSANVTALVQQGGAGTYTTGNVVGTVSASENNANFAGWTLAVVYSSPFLPSRNMSIFVGAEVVNQAIGSSSATISGFATPVTGTVNGRLMVSAGEGDPQIIGDQVLFGPSAGTLTAISGPNNPINNFFCSQINNDQGLIDTTGTFGSLNATPGTARIGARQGWDITNVDVSPQLSNAQTSAVIQVTSQGDAYVVSSLGLQVDVNAPFFVFNKSSNVSSALVGDTIQYTITASNQGTAAATLVLLQDSFPASGSFVPGSLSVNGINQPAANPVTGLNLGVIAPGQTVTIVYSVQIVSRPAGSTQSNVANLTYNFQSLPNGPVFTGMSRSNGNNVTIGNRPPVVPNYALTTNKNVPVSGQVVGTDIDGDPLVYSLNSIPANGTASVNPDGSYTYTPNPGFVGIDSFTVLVSDQQGGTAISTITVTILNQPPVAQSLNLTTNKNIPVNGQVIATDPDGDPLIYVLNTPPANGTAVVNPDGTLTYTPNPGFAGTDMFTVLVSDPNGGTAIATVTIQVINLPPVTANLNLTTPENIATTGQVTGTDPDGDPLTFTLASPPVNGTALVNPNGTFTYTPNLNFIGTDTFTVLVSDPSGGTAVSTVTVQVVNLPPVTSNLTLTTLQNTPVPGQVIATDPNGDPLTFTQNSPPANGTAVVNPDGTLVYTPNTGFVGTDAFTVLVSDGRGGTALANVTISVSNQAPIAQNLTVTTNGNTPASGQVIATDPDGNPLTYALNTSPANGTVVVNPDGTFLYTPNTNFTGTDSFTVIVSDGLGGTAIASVTVNVLNLPPVTSNVTLSTLQNIPASGQVTATDPNADPLVFSLLTPPANGSAVVNPDGSFTYTPATGFVGPDSFSVLVSDGRGGTAVSTVTINVLNQNPVVQDQTLATPQNTPVAGQVVATDPDGDPLTFALHSTPGNGIAVVNPDGSFTYTPNTGFVGTDSFTVRVLDGKGGVAVGTVVVNVFNRPPVAQNLSLVTPVNAPVAGQIPATDPDGNALTYTVSVPPANGSVVLNADGSFTYTPNFNFIGVDTFSVLVSDGYGGTATSNVTIAIPVAAPVTSNVTVTTATNIPVGGQVIATDPQSETLTYTVSVPPANGSVVLNAADGTFVYTPNLGFAGTDTFTVLVTNTSGVFVSSVVTANVSNTPPVAQNLTLNTLQNTAAAGQIPAVDPDGNPLTYTLSAPPALGTVLLNPDGSFTYTPNAGVVGTDTFSVLVSDGRGGTATSVVTVNIIDQPPITSNVQLSTPANVPVAGAVIATDPDGDILIFTLNASPVTGTAVVNPDGTFTYTPNPGFIGPDSFTVLVSDGKGGTAVSTVFITVFNNPPVAVGTSVTTPEDVPVAGAVTATDPEGNPITFTLLNPPVNGTVIVNPDGTFIYTPNATFVGQDNFTVLASDGLGGTAIAPVIVTVTDIPPIAADTFINTNINTPASGQVIAVDPGGDPLTYSLQSPPANGTVVVNPDGTFTYTPNSGFAGSDAFTVLVNDNQGGTAVATVRVSVINQPPVVQNATLGTTQPQPVSGAIIAFDPDGDPLTYAVSTPPASGTVLLNPDGSFTYTPNPAFVGTDFFTVAVSDGRGGTTLGTVTVNVAPNPPVVTDVTLTAGSNVLVAGQITAVDPDGNALTFTLLSPPVNGTVIVNPDGTFTYTPNLNFIGTDSFTVLVTDSTGATSTGTTTINVVNLPPVAAGTSVTTNENVPVSGAVTATDPDGNPLTFTVGMPPANGNAVVNPDGSFTYTPNPGFAGSDVFAVLVSDGFGGTAMASVIVTVLNLPPVAQDLSIGGFPNTPVSGQVIASDPSGDPLTYTINSFPISGTVVLNPNGSFTYTPFFGFTGVDSFTVQVTDSNGASTVATVMITIPLLPPVITDVAYDTLADVPVSGQITAVDPEGTLITFTLATPPATGTVVVNPDGTFTYTPRMGYVGVDSFTVTATDIYGAAATGTVTIQVIAVPPVAPDIALTTPLSTQVSGRATATDPDSTMLLYTLYTPGPANGIAVVNQDGTFTYTPNAGFIGVDTFPIIVTDTFGLNDIAVVTVTVVADAPVAPPVAVSTSAGQPVAGAVLATDPAGLALSYTLGTAPANGTVIINPDGTFTYTPNPGFAGTDSFTVIVTNSAGVCISVPVTVTITPLGGPVTTNIGIGTIENRSVSGSLPATSPAGLSLTYSAGSPPANGTAAVNPDGTFTYIPNPGFSGIDSFIIIVTDSLGRSAQATVTVIVYELPSPAPIVLNAGLATPEGTPVSGVAPGGAGASYALTTPPVHGILGFGANGAFQYIPNAGFVGTDTFILQITDALGNVYLYTVVITVTSVAGILTANYETEANMALTGNLNTIGLGDISGAELVDPPGNASLSLKPDGTFILTPNSDFVGQNQFTLGVTDKKGKKYKFIGKVDTQPESEE